MPAKKTRKTKRTTKNVMSEPAPAAGGRWWVTLFVLSCLGLVVLFDETMILPAIPDFIRDFGISYSTSSWLLSAYIISAAVMTPIAGKLSDIYGRKRMLLIVMAVYIVGVTAGRFADGIETMLAARALQGVGLAMFPIAFGIIRETLPPDRLAFGQSVFGSMFPAGAVVGLVGGAAIIQSYGWQATFLAILPVSVGLWLAIVKLIRKDPPADRSVDRSLDWKGTLALAATITLFLTGINFLEGRGDAYQTAGLFAGSGIFLALFILIEKRARSPLLNFELLRNRKFVSPTTILLLTFFSVFMVYLTIPVMVRSPEPLGFGGDALAVAAVQLPFMVIFLVFNVLSGFILGRVRNTKLTLVGTGIAVAGFLMLLLSHSTPDSVSLGLGVLAVGMSLAMTGGFNVILTSVPMQMTGVALGMTMLLNLIGMSVGPSLAGILQQTYQAPVEGFEGAFPTDQAYALIFLAALVISASSLLLALSVSRAKTPAAKAGSHPQMH